MVIVSALLGLVTIPLDGFAWRVVYEVLAVIMFVGLIAQGMGF